MLDKGQWDSSAGKESRTPVRYACSSCARTFDVAESTAACTVAVMIPIANDDNSCVYEGIQVAFQGSRLSRHSRGAELDERVSRHWGVVVVLSRPRPPATSNKERAFRASVILHHRCRSLGRDNSCPDRCAKPFWKKLSEGAKQQPGSEFGLR